MFRLNEMVNYKTIINNIKKKFCEEDISKLPPNIKQFIFPQLGLFITDKHKFFLLIKSYYNKCRDIFSRNITEKSVTQHLQIILESELSLDKILNLNPNSYFYSISKFIKYNFHRYCGCELFYNKEIKEMILIRNHFTNITNIAEQEDILFKIENLSYSQEKQYVSYFEHIKDIFKKAINNILRIFGYKILLSDNIIFKFNFLRSLERNITANAEQDIKQTYNETINVFQFNIQSSHMCEEFREKILKEQYKSDQPIMTYAEKESRLFHTAYGTSRTKDLVAEIMR